jgi:undecaprenyl-diphosphatase
LRWKGQAHFLSNLQALILGMIQGLTEFLPISSSGHLALASWFFGLQQGEADMALAIGIATNTGTLLAVLLALRKDVALALSGFVRGIYSAEARKSEGWRLALLVIAGCIPTAIIGLLFRDSFEALAAPRSGRFASATPSSSASRRESRCCPASPAPAPPSRHSCGGV